MKVRIINRRLIFQNNGVGSGIALAMYNISYMHARTHWVLHNQVSDVESTTFSTFKVVVIIKLVCAVSYINVEFPVYISGWGEGQYLYKGCGRLTRAVSAHTSIHSGSSDPTKLYPNRSETLGEIVSHHWKYLVTSPNGKIYLVEMGRNPSGPVWIISWFCSQGRCFFSS